MKEADTQTPEELGIMTSDYAVELLQLFEGAGIEVYVDGGWAVDALVGEQTRPHEDIDIAAPHIYASKIRELLEAKGYKDIVRNDSWEASFVLGDDKKHKVDVHTYTFDDEGKNIFGIEYQPEQLTGMGSINGYPVRCISPEWLIKFHSGYKLDEDDYHDVVALCEKFNIPLPVEYEKFAKADVK